MKVVKRLKSNNDHSLANEGNINNIDGNKGKVITHLTIPTLQTNKPKFNKQLKLFKQQKQSKAEAKSKKRYKTHFKGLTYIAGNYFQRNATQNQFSSSSATPPQEINNNTTQDGFNAQLKRNNKPSQSHASSHTVPLSKYQTNPSIFNKYSSQYPLVEDNIDIIKTNPLLYNLNIHMNSNKRSNNRNNISNRKENGNDYDKLDYLRSLAFDLEDKDRNEHKGRNFFRKESFLRRTMSDKLFKGTASWLNKLYKQFIYKDANKVIIDNEVIDKRKIDIIAKKILKKCNFVHSKSVYNDTCLKKGGGKMMITAGMTVNDFKTKFSL